MHFACDICVTQTIISVHRLNVWFVHGLFDVFHECVICWLWIIGYVNYSLNVPVVHWMYESSLEYVICESSIEFVRSSWNILMDNWIWTGCSLNVWITQWMCIHDNYAKDVWIVYHSNYVQLKLNLGWKLNIHILHGSLMITVHCVNCCFITTFYMIVIFTT